MVACPPDGEIAAFVDGALTPSATRAVSEHIDVCDRCRQVVALALVKSDAPTAHARQAGQRVGRFILIGLIGRGGMGAVFSAYDPDLARKVAVKLVRSDAETKELQLRLLREAQAMARLHHPEVITVYEVGAVGDDVFIAMELVDGGTLRQWLREAPRSVGEIVERFARAGDGLAAAHAVGLVHRDFKPDNVLVGSDGRQRVTDFGLARAVGEVGDSSDGDGVSPDSPLYAELTMSGALVGTPAYMAPEQLDGAPIDARADQFSFCVALYQALYGELPFAGENTRAVRAAITRQQMRPPPRGSRVPARLRRVILRGLRARPDDRFGSMRALVDELRRRVRPRGARAAIAAGVVIVVAAAALIGSSAVRDHRCVAAGRDAAEAWSAGRRARVHDAFVGSKLPFAEAVWKTTAALLDDYARDLGRRRVEVCAATEVRHEQPASAETLRVACLRDRQEELASLVDLFAGADAKLVARAPEVAAGLPSFEPCDDVATLEREPRPPRTRAQENAAEALRRRLNVAWARQQAGRYDGLGGELEAIVAAARQLDYSPVEGDALYRLGMWKAHVGELAAAQQLFEASATKSIEASHDVQAELAWGQLARLLGVSRDQPKEAEVWVGLAEAAEKRRHGHDDISVDVMNTRAMLDLQAGRFAEAVARYDRTLALIDELHLAPLLRTQYEDNRAIALANQYRLDESEATFRHVLEEHRRLLGEDHPDTVQSRENLVKLLNLTRSYAEALPLAERGLGQRIAAEEPNSGDVADARYNLADALTGLGRGERALLEGRAAVAIIEKEAGADNPALADYLVPEGVALSLMGRRDEAVRLLERSLSLHEKGHDPPLAKVATEWALARALVAGMPSHRDVTRALALAEAARAAHADAAARWGGNNRARADELAAFIRKASVEGR
jgi:eukaryotic-like serine/threonine-protein kinase